MRLMICLSALLASASVAHAGPMTYGCDTAAGRLSVIELEMPSAGFEITGTITPKEFRKDATWAPNAVVKVESADGKNSAEVRFTSGGPRSKEGLVQLSGQIDGAKREGEPALSSIDQPINFAIKVLDSEKVLVATDSHKGTLPAKMGQNLKLSISCSTGDFVFSNMEWKSAP